jgi:para-aminobenzoate synthetase/4-amino-4-deoxychorismate lyase
LLLSETGDVETEQVPFVRSPGPVTIGLATHAMDFRHHNPFHKTTRREAYELAASTRPDCDQVLLWTQEGHVTETNVASVALWRGGRWVTPPLSDGLLPGTFRDHLLDQASIFEERVRVDELSESSRIAVFNSLAGWREATFRREPGHARTQSNPLVRDRSCSGYKL